MAIREIILAPHPTLKRKAREVKDFGPDLQRLIDDMVETMREAPGVGLAAPQVNVSQRVIVIEYDEDEDEEKPPKLYIMVNPEIARYGGEEDMLGIEGCLSIPEIVGEVARHEKVTVKGLSRKGQPMKVKASGWLARIFQHEIDHLDGVLFTDKAERVFRLEDLETDGEEPKTPSIE